MSLALKAPEHFESAIVRARIPDLSLRDESDAVPRLTVLRGSIGPATLVPCDGANYLWMLGVTTLVCVIVLFMFVGVRSVQTEFAALKRANIERVQPAAKAPPLKMNRRQRKAMVMLTLSMLPYQPNILYRPIRNPMRAAGS